MAKKILIAEDELLVALVTKKKLECCGYKVCGISKTGKGTIESAFEDDPDLMIVDIYLEDDVDGIEAIKEIHKTRYIPAIITTASNDSRTRQRACEAKIVKYLNKPYSFDDLLETIDSVE